MTETRVKIEGLSELQTALRQLPDATARNVVRRVLRAQAEPVAAAARSRAPHMEGNLAARIQVSTKLSPRQKREHNKYDENDVEVFIGAPPWAYAHIQEYGSKYLSARPYMRPAWDSTKESVLEGIKGALWTEIEKAAKRLARKAARNG